ncbi:unnamed protein product [Cladocopium goreaui]|uniref:Insulin-like growth factor-binding protein complex acid labile subunit (ALS) n=1 Tax=Cladocopium goreaui TaxID=2562237 RepID=A0A9P1GJI8_9DINO|nr:unnamed protein product [Cladocopium goreaui]
MADRWCETFGEQRGTRLQFETFNLYHANHWIIKPATDGYAKKGCSMVEIMAIQVQRPHWFVSHAWIICEEPVCKFLACLEQHALVRELSSSTFYWVCAYANNQHCVEEDIKSNPRSTSFYRAMQMSEGVLLVLDSAGTPFDRVLSLKDVSLSEQNITSVADDAFASSRCLQRLSLSANRLPVLPKELFAPLDSLQLLDLGRLGLKQLEFDTFAGLSSLRILSLSQNHLNALPRDLLHPMPALQQLLLGGKSDDKGHRIVDGNELSVLSQELLQHSPRLQVLDLSENKLTSLPNHIFDKTPLLQALVLGSNKLTELPGGIFSGLNNLQELDLAWNRLSELPAGVFSGLSSLQELVLHSNKLRALPAEVFAGLSNLQELNLGENKLSDLPANVFSGLTNLQKLYLYQNELSELPAEVFSGLSNLQELNLGENKLSELPAEVFSGLSSLQELVLHSKKLRALPAEVFAGLSKLQKLYLYLSQNALSELPAAANVFSGLSSLQELHLAHSKLSKLPAEVWAHLFAGLSNLLVLGLESNRLGELSSKVWSKSFAELSHLQVLYLGGNDLSKLHAEAFSTLGNLRTLVLDGCRLNELPLEVWGSLFAALDNLQFLLLRDNKLGELPAEVWANMLSELGQLQVSCGYALSVSVKMMGCSAWGWDFAVMRRKKSSVATAVAPGALQMERRSEKIEAAEFSPVEVANVFKVTLKFTAAARMPSTARLTSFESRGVRLGIPRETRVHLPCPREMLRCILPPTLPEDAASAAVLGIRVVGKEKMFVALSP